MRRQPKANSHPTSLALRQNAKIRRQKSGDSRIFAEVEATRSKTIRHCCHNTIFDRSAEIPDPQKECSSRHIFVLDRNSLEAFFFVLHRACGKRILD